MGLQERTNRWIQDTVRRNPESGSVGEAMLGDTAQAGWTTVGTAVKVGTCPLVCAASATVGTDLNSMKRNQAENVATYAAGKLIKKDVLDFGDECMTKAAEEAAAKLASRIVPVKRDWFRKFSLRVRHMHHAVW